MRVRVVSFGAWRERVSAAAAEGWALPEGSSVAGLLDALTQRGVVAETMLRSAAVAVNHEYVGREHPLAEGDEVAILPPVSGGALDLVQLVREPIAIDAVMESLRDDADGAMVTFDGKVRNNTRGRATLHLDYEAYEEMALKQMAALREEAKAKFAVREVAIVHRLGRLVVGETSVLIVVSSAHRGAAFEACRYVIDTLKKTVPIWKKEQFVDGAVWADGEPFPEDVALDGKAAAVDGK